MKTKAVVFKVHLKQVVQGKKEDQPQRWFRDRVIWLVQIVPSLPPDVIVMDHNLEPYELRRFAEVNMFIPQAVLIVSDDEEFLHWAKKHGFHTVTTYNIDGIIHYILNFEHKKER